MQQQQPHQGGGAQYGASPPDNMGPFSTPPAPGPMPLSSRPPTPQMQPPTPSYEELAAASGAGGFPDDDVLGGGSGGSGPPGNRWPREETLALIRIRSEMDAAFRDATLKAPLWEEVSRKLAELGYKRSAKKCKEKFENVHKYYKRTKEGRTGRQDGKSYRFFSELEALHLHAATAQAQHHQSQPLSAFAAPPIAGAMPPPPGSIQPAPISTAAPAPSVDLPQPPPLSLQGLSFMSLSESESYDESEDDDEMTAETGGSLGNRKRGGGGGKKMMAFFEGLLKQVVERQEEIQRRFLETMERRDAERTAREEAWRRQEVARLNREQEQLSQERAAAAARDASIIAFLQRIGGQTTQVPPIVIPMHVHTPAPAAAKQQRQQPPPPLPQATPQPPAIQAAPLQQQPPQPQHKETTHHDAETTPRGAPPQTSSLALVPAPELHADTGLGGEGGAASSSRWPKTEVHALIQLRMDMDNRYQENGPKGPLWEEISAGMRRLGYNRSSKRCKEKWENINKYFKKVKESNKRRPEDSKTCPYFHQLEAIYRKKHTGAGVGISAANAVVAAATVAAAVPEQQNPNRHEIEGKHINDGEKWNNGGGGAAELPASKGETVPTTAPSDVDTGTKKPEDSVRDQSEQPPREFTTDETDSDDMGDDYTDDGEEGEDDAKLQYRIQFQRPNPAVSTTGAPPPATTTPPVALPTSTPANTFLAMVQ